MCAVCVNVTTSQEELELERTKLQHDVSAATTMRAAADARLQTLTQEVGALRTLTLDLRAQLADARGSALQSTATMQTQQ